MQTLNPETLRHLPYKEGLILQGCGGDLQEWLDGINDLLQENGILLYGDCFKEVSVLRHNERTNLLFDFDKVRLDIGKLARWRLQTCGLFGGTWLCDYVENQLGDFIEQKKEKLGFQFIFKEFRHNKTVYQIIESKRLIKVVLLYLVRFEQLWILFDLM